MITTIQREWLQKIINGEITKADNPRKYSAYMRRIQNRIDSSIENGDWLSKYAPEILKYEEREYDDPNIERHMRLKKLLRICSNISPFAKDQTLVRILSQITPNFGVEMFRKPIEIPKPMVVFRCRRCRGTFEDIEMKEPDECPHCGYGELEEYK